MGKRKHQSSSVEEVSPAVVRRTSSRLTRSKKLKSTVKSSSPVLGKATVRTRQQEAAGPSAPNTSTTKRRLSNTHRLLDLDCVTPVRPRHGRSSRVQLNSPHSESEPEIIWDDKSPNAVQLRRLGKGAIGKRNAIEDISDIINCVPEVIDTGTKKPSLLSLWMTRDSPSPKPAVKSAQQSNRATKKNNGKKKARKSRLSALTHELEKVINAIEFDEEEEEEEEVASPEMNQPKKEKASPLKLPLSKTAALASNAVARVTARNTSPTLYTQTKPTQKTRSPRKIPLPSVGHSPDNTADKQQKTDNGEKSEEKQVHKESSDSTGSDESPPGSQTKWTAIGNESAEDLWGDDDLFEDDGLLMETIEVEIASSQMVQSTPVYKVKKRKSLKGASSVKKSSSEPEKSNFSKDSKSFVKPSSTTAVGQTNSERTKQKTFVRASSAGVLQSQINAPRASSTGVLQSQKNAPRASSAGVLQSQKNAPRASSAGVIQSQKKAPTNQKPIPSSCPVQEQSKSTSEPISLSQKVFVKATQCVPQSRASQMNQTKSSVYSLRSGNNAPVVKSKPQPPNPPVKVPATTASSNTSATVTAHDSSTKALSQSTPLNSITRTNPPSVTRVVYSTKATINTSTSYKTIPSNKFVPFKPVAKPVSAISSTVTVPPVHASHTSSQSTLNPLRSEASNKQCASKGYVPYEKHDAPKKQDNSIPQFVTGQQGNIGQQSKSFAPYGKQNSQNTTLTSAPSGRSQTSAQLNLSKAYVPFKKVPHPHPTTSQASCSKPAVALGSVSSTSQDIKYSHPGHGTTQNVPNSNAGQVSATASVSCATRSNSSLSKQTLTNSTSSENVKPKSFVPFKKPQSVAGFGCQASNTSSAVYKPAIPSSQETQSFGKHSNQFKPSMTTSHPMPNSASCSLAAVTNSKTFAKHTRTMPSAVQTGTATCNPQTSTGTITSVPSTKSKSFVKQDNSRTSTNQIQNVGLQNKMTTGTQEVSTGTKSSTSQCVSNVNTGKSTCSNNNVAIGGANMNSTTGASSIKASGVTCIGTGPVLSSTSVEGGQFDDSLPDEMLMSLIDMDGSWDEF